MKRLSIFLLALVFSSATLAATPVATITGPTGGVAGDIIVLDASGSGADHYKWTCIPQLTGGRQTILPIEGGQRVVVATVPGQYTIVLSVSNAEGLDVFVYVVTISGGSSPNPGPQPQPQPGPNPPRPLFPDSPLGLSQAVYDAAKTVPNYKQDVGKFANNFRGICSQIAAHTLTGKSQIMAAVKSTNNETAGSQERLEQWKPIFGPAGALPKQFTILAGSGKLTTDAHFIAAFTEIAIGLEQLDK
jgi:hypothetical protein